MFLSTSTAPVNIAVIKYWGKSDEKRIIPINDSVSVTLNSDEMHAKTTVAASPSFDRDRLWLNGREEDAESNPRLSNCINQVRRRAKVDATNKQVDSQWKVHVCSENNFPTAAGLASSAAGYACLVHALSQLYGIKGDISTLARQGSGSACRSVYGGFVLWKTGSLELDYEDSAAEQLAPAEHWPQLRIMVLVANDARKKVPSSKGMKLSVETSDLLKYRAEKIVPSRVEAIIRAIKERDFKNFSEMTMRDSNQLHACCLDTFPPCVYMNETSHAVVALIHALNQTLGRTAACYTFDAGPNACLFMLESDVALVAKVVKHFFPPNGDEKSAFMRGVTIEDEPDSAHTQNVISSVDLPVHEGSLKYVIHTRVGDGPKVIGEQEHLLNINGMPKSAP